MTQTPAADIVEQEMPHPIAPFGFGETARQIVDSEPVISTYAAPEWDELSGDGKVWIAKIVEQAWRAGQKVDDAKIEALQRKLDEAVKALEVLSRGQINHWDIAKDALASIRGETGQ